MPGKEGDLRGETAVRDRDSDAFGNGDAACDPRHHLALNAVFPKSLHLLAAATEEEGVAALEPHDRLLLLCVFYHEAFDFVLLLRVHRAVFADVDLLDIGKGV